MILVHLYLFWQPWLHDMDAMCCGGQRAQASQPAFLHSIMFYRNSPTISHLNDFRSSKINKCLQDEVIFERLFPNENLRFSVGKRSALDPSTCRSSAPATQLPTQLQPTPVQDPRQSRACRLDAQRDQRTHPASLPTAQSPAFAESPSCECGWLVTRHVGRLTTTWPRGGGGGARRAILRNTSTMTRRSFLSLISVAGSVGVPCDAEISDRDETCPAGCCT